MDSYLSYNEYRLSSRQQLEGRKKNIEVLEKSNEYYETLDGEDYEHKIAKNKTILTTVMIWAAAYEGRRYNEDYIEKTTRIANEAIATSEKLGDLGNVARATLYRSYIKDAMERNRMEQKADLVRAEELCLKVYGKYHQLYSELCFVYGQFYEEYKLYEESYDYYCLAVDVCMTLYGPNHEETSRRKRGRDKRRKMNKIDK